MVIPFSNTKLRVPTGFQSLLAGLSTEVLRSQPRDIHSFAADYFEKLLQRREQGHAKTPNDEQASHDDRYYNNRSFQEEYPVNDELVDKAATRIQAQFRGHQTRHDLKNSEENKYGTDDDDEREHQQSHATEETPSKEEEEEEPMMTDDRDQSFVHTNAYGEHKREPSPFADFKQDDDEDRSFEVNTHEPPHISGRIQSPIFQEGRQRSARSAASSTPPQRHDTAEDYAQLAEYGEQPGSARSSEHMDSHRLHEDDQSQHSDNENSDQDQYLDQLKSPAAAFRNSVSPRQRFPLDDDQNLDKETDEPNLDDSEEMNSSYLDKAATRIQASYRGYKTRKQLGSIGNHSNTRHHSADHRPPSISSQMLENYESPRNKSLLSPTSRRIQGSSYEHDDNAAAVKIQAAYRGYRVRRDKHK